MKSSVDGDADYMVNCFLQHPHYLLGM